MKKNECGKVMGMRRNGYEEGMSMKKNENKERAGMKKERYDFADLLHIMKLLRSREGCPWDREQTHESLKRYLIEETYEVLDALDANNKERFCEELGDLLLQIVFHAEIASESGNFDIHDVIDGICKKMISRHTHVFGEAHADTPDQVVKNWEEIKKEEKGISSHTEALKDVPASLPALMRSYKVQQKAARAGFDWDNTDDVFKKVLEEARELEEVYKSKNVSRIKDEIGDILFSIVNLARFLKVQPELALSETINKFIKRFEYVERMVTLAGKKMEDMRLSELDHFWDQAKEVLPGQSG
jgi:tetrapyrrole methylase family protein/MazG family protein